MKIPIITDRLVLRHFNRSDATALFALEAVKMLIDYLNRRYNITQFNAVTDSENLPAHRLLKRLRFHQKEYVRESIFVKGCWNNEIHWAIKKK